MKIIYVGGPFRAINKTTGKSDAWGVQNNVMRAMGLALEVWKLGCAALCPHSNTMFFQDAEGINDQVWLDGDIELLRRCDAMLLTPDWARSSGARAEKLYAEANNIPTFQTLADFKDWLRESARATNAVDPVAGVSTK